MSCDTTFADHLNREAGEAVVHKRFILAGSGEPLL